MSAIGMELRKLKRRRYWLMAAGAAGLELAWIASASGMRATGAPQLRLLGFTLNEAMSLVGMLVPLVAALLASRLATVDTEERMGSLLTALGQPGRARFGAKLTVGSFALVLGQLSVLAFVALVAPSMGMRTTAAYQDAVGPAIVVVVAASVAAMAVQLALATCIEKQAIGLAVGAIAGFVCSGLPSAQLEALGWLLPWGIATAASPISRLATFQTGVPVTVAQPWAGALFAVVAAVIWTTAAALAIIHQENHR
ncbi:ABC transporter permease [Actinomyces sp. MRS3W]|uniref:ABC transporter permease n=1 Tax=Actinomyces sp. MRS3W TaxID=2800796 RepID=UPI0028FDBEF1|nr:ABC transporter permease [Actinomyces sp. MRS3W]MDU0348485.1 ABC transporter permease [Actinomyces sp. MRS3W]